MGRLHGEQAHVREEGVGPSPVIGVAPAHAGTLLLLAQYGAQPLRRGQWRAVEFLGALHLDQHGRIVVQQGGRTEFADMRAAYDALEAATRSEIEELVCEHSLIYSRGELGFTELTDEERAMFRPVRQRLVRIHPVTGRKSLFLSSHAGGIIGWPVPEARAFLRDLTEHATQRQFVYSHAWQPYDLVMWDNRQLMHRVTRFDETQIRACAAPRLPATP